MGKAEAYLSVALEWIKRTWSEIVSAPGIIWSWGQEAEINRAIVMAAAIITGVVVLIAVISFISRLVRKKRPSLFGFLFFLALLCAGLWFARAYVLSISMPEAETVSAGDTEAYAYECYSLAPGYSTLGGMSSELTPDWRIVDDTVTWRLDGTRILQLTGLRSLSAGHDYAVTSMKHGRPDAVKLGFSDIGVYEKNIKQYLTADLEIYIFPDRELAGEEWTRESGSVFQADSVFEHQEFESNGMSVTYTPETEYRILDNSGDRVDFLINYTAKGRYAVCTACQIGPDLVVGVSNAYANRWIDNSDYNEYHDYDPVNVQEDRLFLSEPLNNLFNGNVKVMNDVSEETAEKILPGVIRGYPVPGCSTEVFSLSCLELLEMREAVYDDKTQSFSLQELIFTREDPDGRVRKYSLANSGGIFYWTSTDQQKADYEQMAAVYEKGDALKDEALSKEIGTKAVKYNGGWLIRAGKCYSTQLHLYYLTEIEEAS